MPRRSAEQLIEDRKRTAEWYLQGVFQYVIAERLGVTQQQVSLDLKAIRQEWRESAIRDFDAYQAEQLAKIDLLEKEYWEAWDDSKKMLPADQYERAIDGEKWKRGAGDPRYLQGVERCIEKRITLLGLDNADAPLKSSIPAPEGYSIEQAKQKLLAAMNGHLEDDSSARPQDTNLVSGLVIEATDTDTC